MKKLEDVQRIIRDEVETIRNRESGALPGTPYVVLEIIDRLKTLTDWDGRDQTKKLALSIRELVEDYIRNPRKKIRSDKKINTLKNLYEDAEPLDDLDPHPELEVDWDHPRSVEKYSNITLGTSKKNLVKSVRREDRKRIKG